MNVNNIIKNILVPYDGSKYAKKASSYAKDIAKKGDTEIFLLTVVNEQEYLHGMQVEKFQN